MNGKKEYVAMISELRIAPLVESDPRQLLYHAHKTIRKSSYNFIRFMKLYDKWHEAKELKQLEEYAHKNNLLAVPATCLNSWRRRKKFEQSRVQLGKKAYFLMQRDSMNENEFLVYMAHVHCVAMQNERVLEKEQQMKSGVVKEKRQSKNKAREKVS